ncbi:MAG: RNB domain-containing ribonuclease, partial [Methanomicrobiales archaeon]|nr:RNB domain-containing ribonuclease [Methanomicrobiales archaeon]
MPRRPPVDLDAIADETMERYGFEPRFPEGVLREVAAIDEGEVLRGDEQVRDLRDLLWSSIDNVDSQDLDQIEYCEQGPDGEIQVKVAIADVDFFVPKGSRTDRYAAHNGTSVYTGVRTYPLLPDDLSAGISSLLPGHVRRAVVIEFSVLPDGDTRSGEIYRALVLNKAKLVYEEIGAWLEGAGPAPDPVRTIPGLEELLRLQEEAAVRLRDFRMARGALDLETIEARAVVQEGLVLDLAIQEKNIARSIIEEFMVAANGTMAGRLEQEDTPMIQRIVREPKYWDRIVDVAAELGWTLPPEPDAKALSDFLHRRQEADPDSFPDLSLTIVKLMGPGEYLALAPHGTPLGHFALAVTDYTHSTAPNRRYVDIINQRLIKAVLSGNPCPYSLEELSHRCSWLTDRDKAAQKVERFMRKAAAAVLLRNRIGEIFDAFVTGVTPHGTFVRLISPPAEGKVMQGEHGLAVG